MPEPPWSSSKAEAASEARPDPGFVHESWWIRALQEESPAVQRAIRQAAPEADSRGPERSGSATTQAPRTAKLHPEALQVALSLWAERLVGGPSADRLEDEPEVIRLVTGDAKTLARRLARLSLAKWGYVLACGGPPLKADAKAKLSESQRARIEEFRGLLALARLPGRSTGPAGHRPPRGRQGPGPSEPGAGDGGPPAGGGRPSPHPVGIAARAVQPGEVYEVENGAEDPLHRGRRAGDLGRDPLPGSRPPRPPPTIRPVPMGRRRRLSADAVDTERPDSDVDVDPARFRQPPPVLETPGTAAGSPSTGSIRPWRFRTCWTG